MAVSRLVVFMHGRRLASSSVQEHRMDRDKSLRRAVTCLLLFVGGLPLLGIVLLLSDSLGIERDQVYRIATWIGLGLMIGGVAFLLAAVVADARRYHRGE
jgi:hypothetical protein